MANPTIAFRLSPGEDALPSWANVVRVYDETTELERARGREWYRNAYRFARALAETHWHTTGQRRTDQAVGIVAALAQNTSWERNQELALETFAARGRLPGGTFATVVAKVQRIFDGEKPLDVLSGPKIRSFYLAIAAQGNTTTVVVDRHAAHIAYGRVLSDRERNQALRQGVKRDGYGDVADAYAKAATYINERDSEHLSPAQLQAITWVAWRNVLLGEARGDS
jgi:hypothetical protein